MYVCMLMYVCVCDMYLEYGLEYVCVYLCAGSVFITYLHVIKWGSIVQVSTSWTSLARGARSYIVHLFVRIRSVCVHLCICYRSSVHV